MSKLVALQSPPYIPEEWVCIAFLVVFGLVSAFHAFQATFYQTWRFSLAVLFTGALEIAGWALRFRFVENQSDISVFRSQYSILFVAPLPIFAATWGTFFQIIPKLGRHFTRSYHSLYVGFIWAVYVVTLALETIGAAGLYNASSIGGRILLAGSFLYLVLLILSSVLATDTYIRYDATKALDALEDVYSRTRNNKQIRGLFITEVLLFINAVYRVVDIFLLNRNITTKQEWSSDVFNTLFVFIAMIVLSIYHPGQFHKDGPLSHESTMSPSPRSSPRMTHKQLPPINTNIIWKPKPQPGQQAPPPQRDEKNAQPPQPSRVIYSGSTKSTPPTH